jgi:hypothetical protein
MSLFRWPGFALTATLLLGCSSDGVVGPSGRFDHAAATFTCGPADGPAIAIYLASDPITPVVLSGVHVRLFVPGTIDEIRGVRFPISSQSEVGAWFHHNASDSEVATSGYLMVGNGSEGVGVDGLVDLQFPTAGHVHGTFHAEWMPAHIVCI